MKIPSQSTAFKTSPYMSVSPQTLAAIVASHAQLQAWNDLNEHALIATGNRPDAQVVANIQSTAVLIAQNAKIISSQNFELIRALNLFDRTLVVTDIAQGFIAGSWQKLFDKAQQVLSFTKPSDMNLQQAQARTDSVLQQPQHIAVAALAIWQNPEMVPAAIKLQLAAMREHLTHSMNDAHPSHAIGAELGGIITGAIIDSMNPGNKGNKLAASVEPALSKPLDWTTYANLLGGGTFPKPLHKMRDFSGLMIYPEKGFVLDYKAVIYQPSKSHTFIGRLDDQNYLGPLIKATEDCSQYGTGREVFLSAIKKFHQNGNDINGIESEWAPGAYDSNRQQFMTAYRAGASIERASKATFTGKIAGDLGLTSVDISQVSAVVGIGNSTLKPIFKRPDWGGNSTWSDYANKWVLAMGRPSLTVTAVAAIDSAVKPAHAMPMKLLAELGARTPAQQEVILTQIQHNLDRQPSAVDSHITAHQKHEKDIKKDQESER